ncbi:hypothetical protein LPJ56_005821, partial [Coemansia sp. RSA 2599]
MDVALLMNSVDFLTRYIDGISELKTISDDFRKSMQFFEKMLVFDRSAFVRHTSSIAEDNVVVQLDDCTFSWGSDKFSLDPITLTVKRGDFATVVGRIGSGKSSFLSGLCGDMSISSGSGRVFGRIGYVSQKPFVMNDTFRENILMGKEFNKELFWKVVEASAMTEDVEQFPAGDLTEIGSNGINLSGGQIVRLALARALYLEADLYIFDDLLSAVDAQVERQIIERVLVADGIIGDKARILVTHAEHLVPLSNIVISFSEGHANVISQVPEPFEPSTCISALEESKAINEEEEREKSDSKSDQGDAFTIHPEIDHPKLSINFIWRFIQLSGYGVVSVVAGMCLLNVCAIYYVEDMRMGLMLDTNPKTINSTLK